MKTVLPTIFFLNLFYLSFQNDNFLYSNKEFDKSRNIEEVHQNKERIHSNPFDIFNISNDSIFSKAASNTPVTLASSLKNFTREHEGEYLHLRETASYLGIFLRGVSDSELGTPYLQNTFDSIGYVEKSRNDSNTVASLAEIIKSKFTKYKKALENIIDTVEKEKDKLQFEAFTSCCSIPVNQFKIDPHFGVGIRSSISCAQTLPKKVQSKEIINYHSNLTKVFQNNLGSISGLLWQYYMTGKEGNEVLHPAFMIHGSGCRPVTNNKMFLQSRHRESKNVVFLVDRSSTLDSHQFGMAISALQTMLASLTANDRVAIVLMASNSQILDVRPGDNCFMRKLVKFSETVQQDLAYHLPRIGQEAGKTNIEIGLEFAYHILKNSEIRDSDHAQIFIITARTFDRDQEHEDLVEGAKRERRAVKGTVSVSFALIQSIGQILFSNEDLVQEIVDAAGDHGAIYTLKSSFSLTKLGDWYNATNFTHTDSVLVSLPDVDRVTGKTKISLSRSLPTGDVVGLDVDLTEIIEDMFWTERDVGSKSFLIDINGVTISHPDIPLKSLQKHFDIAKVDTGLSKRSNLLKVKSMPSGELTIDDKVYTWMRVDGTPYIVVLSTDTSANQVTMHLDTSSGTGHDHISPAFQYHSHVTSSNTKLCRHMNNAASMETAALYLAPAAFARPAAHLAVDTSAARSQAFMAYLTDPTRLIANPGLKVGVRDVVLGMSLITNTWKKQAYSSSLNMNNYIVRRRVVSPNGVQLSYPATQVTTDWDPTLSPWYYTALKMPDLVTISPPHLDQGGAGYVVTMSSVVSSSNTPMTVISADFTQGYFHKIVNDLLHGDICYQENMTCFLMDHRGFMISHPLMTYRDTRPQSIHLTHLEPSVATDLLSDKHQGFMTKSICRKHSTQTLQRIFTIDFSYQGRVESSDDYCSQYSLQRVSGTNLYLGVVNKTCESNAFCWCSTIDRSCLDCSRLSQDECECPCECSDDKADICSATGDLHDEDPIPTCAPEYEVPVKNSVRFSTVRIDQLPACINTDCQSRHQESDCSGVLGCSWCQYEKDTVTPLISPHCSQQEVCYSGIMSYPSPYSIMADRAGSHSLASEAADRPLFKASPIGPVAGGIMAFFALLAITGWAYRQWSRGERRLLVNSSDQDRVIMDAGYEDDSPDDAPSGGHNNFGLHHNSISVVSPYKMNPGYRRPRPAPGTDSDHGYSTMTPGGDQDSEIMSCLGRDVNTQARRDKFQNKNPISLQSVTSGASSRTSSPALVSDADTSLRKHSEDTIDFSDVETKQNDTPEGVTNLKQLGRNQILVAATIHTVET